MIVWIMMIGKAVVRAEKNGTIGAAMSKNHPERNHRSPRPRTLLLRHPIHPSIVLKPKFKIGRMRRGATGKDIQMSRMIEKSLRITGVQHLGI
jgi:hypothetical protein